MTSSSSSSLLKKLAEGCDVTLSHLKRLVFGELAVVTQCRNDVAEPVEGAVEVVHAPAFTGVGGQSSLLHHLRCDFLGRPFAARRRVA